MNLLHRLSTAWRYIRSTLMLLAIHLLTPPALWAQSPGSSGHDQVIPYLLVVLCLALALILLCRSSSRSKDVRLDDLDED